jgi:uncharacterized delta-60 repeat protein
VITRKQNSTYNQSPSLDFLSDSASKEIRSPMNAQNILKQGAKKSLPLRKVQKGRRQSTLKGKGSPITNSRALTALVIITIMATAPALTTTATSNQSQQTSNPNGTTRESAPTTGIYWAKSYGGTGYDSARSAQQTSDGGYVVAGVSTSFGTGSRDAWVLKLNSTGGVDWQKLYNGSNYDEADSVQQTADGGYIVAGYTYSFGAGNDDVWVLKLNATGGTEWQKSYGGSGYDGARSVQQTSDGGYVVAGFTSSFGVSSDDIWILKLNSTGGVDWQKTYGGSDSDEAYCVQQTSDGGIIVAGHTYSYGVGNNDIWVLKLNSTGGVDWQKIYGGLTYDFAYSVQQTKDGGYVVAGWTDSFGAGNEDVWVLKLNGTGSVTWQKTYGGAGYDDAYSVQQTSDGGYVVAGSTTSFGAGRQDVWVLKLNSTGSVTWQKTFGGTQIDYAWTVQQTKDGGYVVAGRTDSFGAGSGDVWVLKLDSTGSLIWDTGSGASTQTTNVSPSDSSAATSATSVTPTNSAATAQDTHVTPMNTHATVKVQSTPDTVPPATITDLAAGHPTNTTITLTWTAPGDDGMKGNATGYVMKYSAIGRITASNWSSATTYNQTWTPAKNGTTEIYNVTGLTPGTKYWFAVEAYDEVPNYGSVSNSPNATTTAQGIPVLIIVGVIGAVVVVGVVLVAIVLIKRKKPT